MTGVNVNVVLSSRLTDTVSGVQDVLDIINDRP